MLINFCIFYSHMSCGHASETGDSSSTVVVLKRFPSAGKLRMLICKMI